MGFIIDGMSENTTKGWSHALMSMQDELHLASRLVTAIGEFAPCITTVGTTIAESLVASDLADFFIAPAGSILAKYKWLSNKPGVVISNSVVLNKNDDRGWSIRVFEEYRENMIPSIYVDPKYAIDIESQSRNDAAWHANFEMEWENIFPVVEELISRMGLS
ncbi:MAG: hypothetical protein WDN49_04010 [Acetobacteraceae bacterium]